LGDGQRRQREVVGPKDQVPVVLGIVKLDATQVLRVALVAFGAGQSNGLVVNQPCRLIHGA